MNTDPFRCLVLSACLALMPSMGVADENGNPPGEAAYEPPRAVDLNALPALERIIPRLAEKRVVYVGETHDRYDHHLNQLEIIRRLHALDPRLVIALEFFQQPAQPYLDAYVSGELDERAFLEKTQYFERWGYDYRYYRPIIEYAREHSIPLLALNVPGEIVGKIGQGGLDALGPEERNWVPERMDRSDGAYRARLKRVFDQHPNTKSGDFERFYEVQLLWDEAMAARAARYLQEHPERRMVLLAGAGHLAYGAGIPGRLARRVPVEGAVVLQETAEDLSVDLADFLLLSQQRELPPAGRLGVVLNPPGDDGVRIEKLPPDSAGAQAGFREQDRIAAIDGQAVQRLGDLKFALMDKRPGDRVQVKVVRETVWPMDPETLEFTVTLQ